MSASDATDAPPQSEPALAHPPSRPITAIKFTFMDTSRCPG